MRILHTPFAALLLTLACPAQATPAGVAPDPSSIEISFDPPPADGAAVQDVNRICRAGTISNGIRSSPISLCLEAFDGHRLDLTLTIPEDQWSESLSLISAPKIAVAYLSDRRFEDFWPLLIRFGGEDGGKLIEAILATRKERAAAVPRGPGSGDTLLSALRQASRAAVAEARILSALGLTPEALELLDQALPQPDSKGRYNKRKSSEWIAVSMTRAASLGNAGRPEDAIEVYRKMEQNDAIAAEYRLNAVVNRAALFAELGQGAAALELIESAERQFVASPGSGKIEGSMRQFDWIRSCALHKLGRSDEARRVVSDIFSSPRPASKDFFVPAGATLEARYRWCVGDLDWLNGQFRRDLEQPLAPAGAVSILYGKAPPFPQHQQMVNAIWSQLRDPNTMGAFANRHRAGVICSTAASLLFAPARLSPALPADPCCAIGALANLV